MEAQAFWIPEGKDLFRATIYTQGPWNPQYQHGGPPAALLVRQIEQISPRPDMVLSRVSVDILGPIPIDSLHAHANLIRPGRNVELLEAYLVHEGRPLMHASGWRIRAPADRPPGIEPDIAPDKLPLESAPVMDPAWTCGYLDGTEWRFTRGSFISPGPATAWTRMRYPLVAGEETTPAQRLILAADAANGVSSPLDIREWQFIPPELTVHSLRPPEGEWVCLDALTVYQAEGTGLTTTALYDSRGLVGRSAQSLLISRRTEN